VSLVGWLWRTEVAERRQADARLGAAVEARRGPERLAAGLTLDQGIALCERGDVADGLLWLARALERAEAVGDTDLERAARASLAAWQPCLGHAPADPAGWVGAVLLGP